MSHESGTQRLGPGTGVLGTDAGGALVVRRVRLRVVSGPDRGQELLLEQGTLLIGSHEEADLTLHDKSVSRYHVELVLLPEGVRVRDLRSTNGTFVGESKIEAIVVQPGSEVRIGRTRIELLPADVPVPDAPSEASRFGRLVGASPLMRRLYAQLERVAGSNAPLLIFGEAGVGKNEAARAVHEASVRGVGPLAELDLRSGITPGAVEAEMHHTRGGTLILDHIDEAPRALQDAVVVALDRLERGQYDVRPIALARSDLRELVESGVVRRDLWFALAAVRVHVPPLRDRLEDLGRLVRDIVRQLGYPDVDLGAQELGFLRGQEFAGNVRELRRLIEQTLLTSERVSGMPPPPPDAHVAMTDELVQLPFKVAKERLVDAFERRYVDSLLERHDGNVSRAAQEAGVDRNHLARLAKKHGLR